MRSIFVNYIYKNERGELLNRSKILEFAGSLNADTIRNIYKCLNETDGSEAVITFFHILED